MSRERARKSERGQTLVSNNGGMLACAARTNCPTVKTSTPCTVPGTSGGNVVSGWTLTVETSCLAFCLPCRWILVGKGV